MSTSYTSLLGLALPVQGELQGTWGDVVNQQITELLDSAVAGTTILSTDADVTLSTTTGAANQARQAIIRWTATGTTTRNITAPAQSKAYLVFNSTGGTQNIVFRGAGPTTGVTIGAGTSALLAWNGSDFVQIGGSSNVSGPTSSTDNAIARFDGTTGKVIQNSGVTIDDNGNMVVSVNSTTNALRITQVGTGNAFLVEDSANPDSTPFAIDQNGRLITGNTASVTLSGSSIPSIQVNGTSTEASYSVTRWENTASQPFVFLAKSRSATVGTFGTIVQSGDTLGTINFLGDDGTVTPVVAASISAAVDGTPGSTDMPGRLVFSTTADGASSASERFRITNAGAWGLSGANYGTSGQVLTSQGTSSPPVWASASSSTSIGLVRAISINCILP
jgi:hypothetical protein